MSSESESIPSYSEMLAQYLESQKSWIGLPELPLVHLLRDICRQIDATPDGDSGGHITGRYLAAIQAIDKRRPRKPATTTPTDQAQTDIFDFLD